MKGPSVIVAGHVCLDITPVIPSQGGRTPAEVYAPGKLVEVGAADVHTGGAVANTGLAMAYFGLSARLIARIGRDAFGEILRTRFKECGAQDGLLECDNETTSYSVVLAMPGFDRTFLHHPGANQTFCAADVPNEALAESSLLHFGYPPLMRTMYEYDGTELTALFRRAKTLGVATSLDLAAVDPGSPAGRADWETILSHVLPYVDFFVPSIEEAAFMLDRPLYDELQSRSSGGDCIPYLRLEDARRIGARCMALGAKVLLLKCGAKGLYYRTAGQEQIRQIGERARVNAAAWANREGAAPCYQPEHIRSATGAGDVSIAAFLSAMLTGRKLERCVQLAAAAGAKCLESYDALGGLCSLNELESKMDEGWPLGDCLA